MRRIFHCNFRAVLRQYSTQNAVPPTLSSISKHLEKSAATFRFREVIISPQAFSYAQAEESVADFARGFKQLAGKEGTLIFCHDGIANALSFLASARASMDMVFLSSRSTARTIAETMRQYKTRGIVINGPQDYEKIQEIIPNLFQYDQATPIRNGHFPHFRFPIQLDSKLEGPFVHFSGVKLYETYPDLLSKASGDATIRYGNAKVPYSAVEKAALKLAQEAKIHMDDRILLTVEGDLLPESHVTLLAAISSTASVAFSEATFNPSQNLRNVEQLKLNTLLLTESQAEEILEESSKFDISSLKKVILTGNNEDRGLIDEIRSTLGVEVFKAQTPLTNSSK